MSTSAPINPWVPITAAMLEKYAPGSLIQALATAATQELNERLSGLIATVTIEIRGAVSSNPNNLVDVDPTLIPPDLEACACWLVLDRLQGVAGMELNDTQVKSLERETGKLRLVANGTLAVSQPLNPSTPQVQPRPKTQFVRADGRGPQRFTRGSMNGL